MRSPKPDRAQCGGEQLYVDVIVLDILDHPAPAAARYDVILVGDLSTSATPPARALGFLDRQLAAGTRVLIGDPGRTYLPKERLDAVAEYSVPVTRELEDLEIKRTTVWELCPLRAKRGEGGEPEG